MHVRKIVSFSVVILLITVLFGGVITVSAAVQIATTLTATAPTTASVSENFTVTGQITANGSPVPWQSITLQNSTDNATALTLAGPYTFYRYPPGQIPPPREFFLQRNAYGSGGGDKWRDRHCYEVQ